jgi:hypothetical protein
VVCVDTKKHAHTVKLMTLTEQENLVNMIKWNEERKVKTVLVSGLAFDVSKTFKKELKIWGMTIWHSDYVIVADLSNVTLANKAVGFNATINKDT